MITGDGGPQEVHGHGRNDTICGGDGEDHLAGGEDSDKIFGEGRASRRRRLAAPEKSAERLL